MRAYLVAGASRGIGLEVVKVLSAMSSTSYVFAGVRNLESLPDSVSHEAKVFPIQLDVNSSNEIEAAISFISKTTNGILDVLIVNAGINVAPFVAESSVEQLRATMETNTVAVHGVIQASLPLLRAGPTKKIIAIGAATGTFVVATHMAHAGMPVAGPYSVSKAATHMLVALYAAELGKDGFITACVHPGVVDMDMLSGVMKAYPEMLENVTKVGFKMITANESAKGIVEVVEGLSADKSGSLIGAEDGKVIPF